MAREGKTLERYDSHSPCINCGSSAEINTLHHLNSQGSCSEDAPWNLCPLCVKCHHDIHMQGRQTFVAKRENIGIKNWMIEHDWYICPSSKKWRH